MRLIKQQYTRSLNLRHGRPSFEHGRLYVRPIQDGFRIVVLLNYSTFFGYGETMRQAYDNLLENIRAVDAMLLEPAPPKPSHWGNFIDFLARWLG